MLAYHLATLVLAASPDPSTGGGTSDAGGGGGPTFESIVPLITGAGGALVVLAAVMWMFVTDKITTTGAVARLREADNNRFNDMVAQRDSLVKALEESNTTSATATESARQSLAILRDIVPEQYRRGDDDDVFPPRRRR